MIRRSVICMLIVWASSSAYAQFTQGPNNPSASYTSGIGGSSATWLNPGNVYASDNSYATLSANLATNGNYADFLVVDGFGFSIPGSHTINGIEVDVERNDGNGKSKDYIVRLVDEGAIQTVDRAKTAAWTATDTYSTYGGSADDWGKVWTPFEINDPDFGFAITVERTGGGASPTLASIDHIRVTVYYSAFVLPIELNYFNGTCDGDAVSLDWSTASESNNSHFEVERADASGAFELIGVVDAGDPDKNYEAAYHFEDNVPKEGLYYYRLRQVDLNGESKVFESVEVDCQNRLDQQIELNINGRITAFDGLDFTPERAEVYALNGSLVHSLPVQRKSSLNLRLDLGVYFVRLQNANASHGLKVFVP